MKHVISIVLVAGLCACSGRPAGDGASASADAAGANAPAADVAPAPRAVADTERGSPASTGNTTTDAATPPPGAQGIAVGEPNPSAPGGFQPPDTGPPGSGLARFDGYGDMKFGMTPAQAKAAWGGELNGKVQGKECSYLSPKANKVQADLAFMFEDGRFVRYDVGTDKEVAPGGGRRGMTGEEIRRLYAGRVTASPHHYVEGGQYLKVKGDGGAIVFETDARGTVTGWQAGVEPQVNYIEGCS